MQATLERRRCVLRVRRPWEGIQQGATGSHLNPEKTPLAAALRMDDKRGSWEISWETTAVVQAWIKRAMELI